MGRCTGAGVTDTHDSPIAGRCLPFLLARENDDRFGINDLIRSRRQILKEIGVETLVHSRLCLETIQFDPSQTQFH